MKHPIPGLLALALSAGLTAPVLASKVDITFTRSEHYTDASTRPWSDAGRAAVLDELRTHLIELGDKYLPPGRQLHIEVLDIDLAGRFEPWRFNAHDVRFLREVTWPRIKLRYTLRENTAVLASAEEAVADMNYLWPGHHSFGSDRLRYEKRMLDRWFRQRFAAAKAD